MPWSLHSRATQPLSSMGNSAPAGFVHMTPPVPPPPVPPPPVPPPEVPPAPAPPVPVPEPPPFSGSSPSSSLDPFGSEQPSKKAVIPNANPAERMLCFMNQDLQKSSERRGRPKLV